MFRSQDRRRSNARQRESPASEVRHSFFYKTVIDILTPIFKLGDLTQLQKGAIINKILLLQT